MWKVLPVKRAFWMEKTRPTSTLLLLILFASLRLMRHPQFSVTHLDPALNAFHFVVSWTYSICSSSCSADLLQSTCSNLISMFFNEGLIHLTYILGLVRAIAEEFIRHENGGFRKRSSNRRNLKTPALRFNVNGKQFENGGFRKRWDHDIDLPNRGFVKHKTKMTGAWCFFKFFSGAVRAENIWCVVSSLAWCTRGANLWSQ